LLAGGEGLEQIIMKIYCCTCGKQAVNYNVSPYDENLTILKGSKAAFKSNEVFCGYCAVDLDENGLFPEEKALAELND